MSIIGRRASSAVGIGAAAMLMLVTACNADPKPAEAPPTSKPPVTKTSPAVPAVEPPSSAETGEVARFWFARPGDNNVALGPFVAAYDVLVVRGACRSVAGTLTWKVFDNSKEADTAREVTFTDEGEFTCDGTTQEAEANVGELRELGVLGVTGTPQGQDQEESAWLTLANE